MPSADKHYSFRWKAVKDPITSQWSGFIEVDVPPSTGMPMATLTTKATGATPADAVNTAATAMRKAAAGIPVPKKIKKSLSITRLLSNPILRKALSTGANFIPIPGAGAALNLATSLIGADGGPGDPFAKQFWNSCCRRSAY